MLLYITYSFLFIEMGLGCPKSETTQKVCEGLVPSAKGLWNLVEYMRRLH